MKTIWQKIQLLKSRLVHLLGRVADDLLAKQRTVETRVLVQTRLQVSEEHLKNEALFNRINKIV